MPTTTTSSDIGPERAPERAPFDQRSRTLHEQWNSLNDALRDARQAGTEAWPEMRVNLEHALDDVTQALSVAAARFRAIRGQAPAQVTAANESLRASLDPGSAGAASIGEPAEEECPPDLEMRPDDPEC